MSITQHDDSTNNNNPTAEVPTINPGDLPTSRSRLLNPGETPQSLARDGYNVAARNYLQWNSTLPDHRIEWLQKAFDHWERSNNIKISLARSLDVGCGAGTPATLHMAQQCSHVTGVEISSLQISLARSLFLDAGVHESKYRFYESDMLALEFLDNSFDLVCGFYSIIHLFLDDQRVLLAKMYKWLAPGGMLLFNVSTAASGEQGHLMENWLGMKAYWASFGEEQMVEILKDIGFAILEYEVRQAKGDAIFTWFIASKPPVVQARHHS